MNMSKPFCRWQHAANWRRGQVLVKLLLAASHPELGEREMPSVLKISPFAARDYSNALRNFPPSKIMENLRLLKEADLRIKGVGSGNEDEGQLLRELVVRLIR